jgi:hypothetical protein
MMHASATWLLEAAGRALNLCREEEGVDEALKRLAAQDVSEAAMRPCAPRRLPACRHLPRGVAAALSLDSGLAAAIADVEDCLEWRQTPNYSDEAMGQPGYLDNYAHAEVIGPHGLFPGDDFLFGLMILGPGLHYLDHYHPAPELYWLLSGSSEWKRGDGGFELKRVGATIWHTPMTVHATRTLEEPLLTLYCWTRDVAEPARLVER